MAGIISMVAHLGTKFLEMEVLGEHNRLMGHFPAFIPFRLLSGWL
ncbi:hypothetical protein [Bartonella sp. ML69XJBT]|nr:hypothetical protein [Bartonella sp. ML69XJBT]